MVREDLIKIYAFAQGIWNSFKIPLNDLDAKVFGEAWYVALAPYPLDLVFASMFQYAKESDFCNVAKISAICERYSKMHMGTYIDEEQTLENIRKAIDYTNYRKNFENLTHFEKEIVGGAHMLARWAMEENIDTVIMSNLRKIIKHKLESKQFEENLKNIKSLNLTNNKVLRG